MEQTNLISTWRILIVDDEPDNLNLAADFLEFSGATVFRADGGQQALELFEQEKPTIVLLDLAMPDLDGWEVHRRLRAWPNAGQIPIIALTALAMPSDAEKVRAAGFDGYVTKPFRMKKLLDEVNICVTKYASPAVGREPYEES